MTSREYKSVVVPILLFLNYLPECKAINIHGSIYSERGTPDILCCYRGRMVVMEAKTATGKPSESQKIRLEQWRRAGALAGVVRSVRDVQVLLELI